MNLQYEWTPGIGVGPYQFGDPIQKYIDAGRLRHFPIRDAFGDMDSYDDEAAGIVVFPKDDDNGRTIVQPDDEGKSGTIDSLTCHNSMRYRNSELLGITLDAAVAILKHVPQVDDSEIYYDDDDIRTTADFDELGLTLWFRDGISVSASVMEIIEGDD